MCLDELIERTRGLLVCPFEFGVLIDEGRHVLAVGRGVLTLLSQKGIRLGSDVGRGIEPVLGLAQGLDDVLLERHRDEREDVAEDAEVGVRRLPQERHRVVELPADLAYHQIRHGSPPPSGRLVDEAPNVADTHPRLDYWV